MPDSVNNSGVLTPGSHLYTFSCIQKCEPPLFQDLSYLLLGYSDPGPGVQAQLLLSKQLGIPAQQGPRSQGSPSPSPQLWGQRSQGSGLEGVGGGQEGRGQPGLEGETAAWAAGRPAGRKEKRRGEEDRRGI